MPKRWKRPRVLPKGAGKVRCTVCGAWAAADGKGSPIVVICQAGCACSFCKERK